MISACMTVSVRELRTAVREWACCMSTTECEYFFSGTFWVHFLIKIYHKIFIKFE